MKKILPLVIAIFIIALLFILTKPSSDNFDEYLEYRAHYKEHSDDTIVGYHDFIVEKVLLSKKYEDKIFYSRVTLHPEHLYNPKTNKELNPKYEYIGLFGTWFCKSDIFNFRNK